MSEKTDTNAGRRKDKASKKDDRSKRLKAKLQANLQRRKSQVRARLAETPEKEQ